MDRSSSTPPRRDHETLGVRRLAEVVRRLVPTGPSLSPLLAMSTGSGSGGGGFRSGGSRSDGPGRPTGARGGTTGSGVGGPRLAGSGAPAPRPERYWTDYLRILLPVIGLILMLSVFIFWVDNIISGDDDGEPTVPVVAMSVAPSTDPNAAQPSPTVAAQQPTTAPSEQPVASEDPAAGESAAPEESEEAAPSEEPAEEPAPSEDAAEEEPSDDATGEEAAFATGDAVTMGREGNLRTEASTQGAEETVIELLPAGTALTIVGGPENDGEFDWYEVEGGSEPGWVREDFLEAAAG